MERLPTGNINDQLTRSPTSQNQDHFREKNIEEIRTKKETKSSESDHISTT